LQRGYPPALQVLKEQSAVLRRVLRQAVRQLALSVPSWAALWERRPARSTAFLAFNRLLLPGRQRLLLPGQQILR